MFQQYLEPLLLLGALIAFYISSRAAADALDHSGKSPGRSAIGHALPIVVAALIAAGFNRPGLAVTILFSTSVAALTLVGGLAMLTAIGETFEPRKVWALLLPVALLAWVAGFASELLWLAALALLIEGLAILPAWSGPMVEAASTQPPAPRRSAMLILRPLQLLLALALALIGIWAAIEVFIRASGRSYFVTEGLFASAVIGPILVLPMIGSAITRAQQGRMDRALDVQTGVTMLNLCLFLPLAAGVWWIFHGRDGLLPIPLGTWRIDNVALIVLGLLMLCLGTRLWRPSKTQGGILVIAYLAYLLLSLRAAMGM